MARYEWPPLPVLERDVAADLMADAMQTAWDDLEAERVRVLENPRMLRKRLVDATLREFQAAIDRFGADVAYHLDRFAALHLAPQYLEGVAAAGGAPVWTAIHQQAFVSLATDTYADFLQRSEQAGKTARRFARAVRDAARAELPKAAAGRTVVQVAERFEARLLSEYQLTHVIYRDGSRVPVDLYTRMAARTKSAVAFNAGTLNESYANGVGFVEVFDGGDCGWENHGSTDKAAGTIRSVEEAAQHPISHPQCQRGFGPRPDITSKTAAKKSKASTTADQRLDQASIDWTPARQAMRDRTRATQRLRIQARRAARQQRLMSS